MTRSKLAPLPCAIFTSEQTITWFERIIGKSDRTGYVAVAQGKAIAKNKDVTAVGRGTSQAEADQKALALLNANCVTENEQIVYRYFSYGADSGAHQTTSRHARHAQRAHVSKVASHM